MGYDYHVLSRFNSWQNCVIPEWQNSVDCCLQTLSLISQLLQFLAKMLGLHPCTFYRIWGVFDRFRPTLVVECQMIFSKSRLVPCRVFRQFRAYLTLEGHHSAFH